MAFNTVVIFSNGSIFTLFHKDIQHLLWMTHKIA